MSIESCDASPVLLVLCLEESRLNDEGTDQMFGTVLRFPGVLISQDLFDETIIENMQVFELSEDEALQETVEQILTNKHCLRNRHAGFLSR